MGSYCVYTKKMTKWIFVTMTSPEKQFHDVEAVVRWIKKKNPTQWKLVSEMGDSGTNPHIHFVFPMTDTMRIDNVKDPLMKAYYGPALDEFMTRTGFKYVAYMAKTVNGLAQLKNEINYFKKEMDRGNTPQYEYGDINIVEFTKGMITYDEHKAITASKSVAYSMDKLLVMATEEYYAYLQEDLTSLECYVGYKGTQPKPPDKEDFKQVVMRLHQKNINLMTFYKNMKPFYINWLAQLGNYTAMERFIDKIDDDLNIRN